MDQDKKPDQRVAEFKLLAETAQRMAEKAASFSSPPTNAAYRSTTTVTRIESASAIQSMGRANKTARRASRHSPADSG